MSEAIISEFSRPERDPEVMDNPAGIQPVEYKCLVKPFHIMDTDEQYKSAKEAGIIIAETETEREQHAQVIALLVAVGGNAFEDWKGRKPEPGDRVMLAKYAGVQVDGMDGRKYRLVSDKDLAAVLFKPEGIDPEDAD